MALPKHDAEARREIIVQATGARPDEAAVARDGLRLLAAFSRIDSPIARGRVISVAEVEAERDGGEHPLTRPPPG